MLLLSPTKEPYCYEADEVTQMQKASLLLRMLRPNKKEINHVLHEQTKWPKKPPQAHRREQRILERKLVDKGTW